MNELTIIHELGGDADLLTYSDSYLETQRKLLAAEISRLAEELDSIQKAIHIKRVLHQTNRVATRRIHRAPTGQVSDVSISIMPLPDALKSLRNDRADAVSRANEIAQILGWGDDGHDLSTASNLRP